jgi:hypothetical protein
MSYIVMSSDRVAQLAQECIERILEHRRQEWTDAVDREKEHQKKSWFRRLFRIEVQSDEAILESLRSRSGGINYIFYCIENYGSENIRIAKQLLKAAAMADVVHVSAEDLSCIS